jgi:hypothetical protein
LSAEQRKITEGSRRLFAVKAVIFICGVLEMNLDATTPKP